MRLGLGIGLQYGRRAGGGAQGPSNTVAPAITGTAERGELLTCSTGTWTGTGTITYAYQWRRNGAPIAGATSNTYTLVAADDNATITCIVAATDDTGSRAASSNAVGPVLGAPFNLAAPVLTGTETVGQTLSVTTGTWQGVATITFAYQWRRDGVAISGATSSTYTLVAADYDAVIDCVVTATNSIDSTTADSNETGVIAGLAPMNDTAPSISGSTGLGDTLTRVAGSWSGAPTPSISGQWRRDGVAIAGETGATYTIALADSGAVIDYLETATNAEGTATADSNDITAQTFVSPTIGGVPTIAGTEEVGETLTATAAAATGNPAPVTSWQWQRSADGSTGWADIAGATASTYTLVAADETNYVRVKQIETNALGTDEAVSAATGQITAPSNTDFRILVKTDNAGVSNSDQFNFTGALGDYDVEVYDSTGTTLQETITGLSDAATITIAVGAGTYELRVFPAATNGFNRIRFNSGGDKDKLLEIRNWGDVVWSTMNRAFRGCSNLGSEQAHDVPDLSSMNDMSQAFRFASSFNQDISQWDVSNITNMALMFQGATAFNQDISEWDVSNVTNMSLMLEATALSTVNYDALLIGWNSLPSLQSNVSFSAGNTKYTAGGAAEAARTNLATTYSWTITDGGSV
jgi:surface protein